MARFTLPIKILFQHCDPAGIVFYPRYFEMVNQVVEAWFEEALGYAFADMQFGDECGVPTVSIAADFAAPSRMGEVVAFSLEATKLGRTSVALRIEGRAGDERRLTATPTLVYIAKSDGRPVPWPEAVSRRIEGFLAVG